MSTLKICRICLRTEAKGYKFERYQLKYFYEEVTALKVAESDDLPKWFCYECAALLHKFHKFKEKCYIGQKYLKELLWNGPITYESIYKLAQATKLQSLLEKIIITDKVKTFTITDNVLESRESENTTLKNTYIHEYSLLTDFGTNGNKHEVSDHISCKTSEENIDIIETDQVKNCNYNLRNDSSSIIKEYTDPVITNDTNLVAENCTNLDIENDRNLVTRSEIKSENNTDPITESNTNIVSETAPHLVIENDTHIDIENNTKSFHEIGNAVYTFSSDNIPNKYNDLTDSNDPISILVQGDKVINIKTEDLISNKSKNIVIDFNSKVFNKYLNVDNWKKVILTEEEAVKEFRLKAEEPKYLDATYKCMECFKGFSKKDMLSRHMQSRHSEELGSHECRFCRMRFKWRCHLRKHIQQHYTKYECLRCHVVFHLDTSALLHEEYHSGATKKCLYCDEEFRHVTTYYTHMRTHRSAHVCVDCGASFVSRAGLRQHVKRKHPDDQLDSAESQSEDGESYCSRCELRFNSRRALTEHLFHSDMHTELLRQEQDAATPTRKIMGKRLREKITKELRKRNSDIDGAAPVKAKRRKRVKRKHRKPSKCYQCGLEFSTQAACMKHHVTAHPRTSFHAPQARHICELCGASLAPGSVAVHQNMHSRERVHTCDSCGRQFHSAVGLKRHLVTHTGEKPFACPLCEKRFTQSNSMKLHYRTFHLKQPYPKRIRKKKKDESNVSTEQDLYEEESDSVPETAPEALPEVTPELPSLQVVGDNGGSLEEENIHYLTLS